MITRVFFGARRGDMTTQACLDHWRGTHAAIGASMPGVRAYVQNHGVLEGGRFLLPYPGFDIMPELDWDDLAAMDHAIDSPAHATDSVDDEENFLDTSRTGYTVTERHVLHDGLPPEGAVKLFTLFRRAPNATPQALHDTLTGAYAEAVRPAAPLRHEALLALPDRQGRPPFAVQAIDVIWFEGPEDALAWSASEAAYRAAWTLSGVTFGCERLIARPNKVL